MDIEKQKPSSLLHSLFCLKTKTYSDAPISRGHKWAIYCTGLLETFIFGGCIFGWAQLVYVLKNEQIFLDLCEVNETKAFNNSEVELSFEELKGCPEQDKKFALIYTIGCLFYGAIGLLSGFMLHHCGLVISRILATFALSAGFLALGYSNKDATYWLYVAIMLLAYGGNQLRLSGLQFCNLFPKNKSTALTIISGSYAASAGLFLTFQIGQSYGLTLWIMSFCLAILALISMLASVIMPWHHIPYEESKHCLENKMPLKNSILSVSTLTYYYWFIVLVIGLRFYTLIFNPWISKISTTNEEAGLYSFLFSISNFICPFVTPFPGMINDYFTKRARSSSSKKEEILKRDLKSPVLTLMLMVVLTIALQVCLMIYHPVAVYASLVILIIIRPCIISVGIAFVRIRYPPDHFDRLNGLCDTIISVVTPIQYPFFLWTQKSPIIAMSCFILLLVLTFSHPFHLLLPSYRKKIAKERFQSPTEDETLKAPEKHIVHLKQ